MNKDHNTGNIFPSCVPLPKSASFIQGFQQLVPPTGMTMEWDPYCIGTAHVGS